MYGRFLLASLAFILLVLQLADGAGILSGSVGVGLFVGFWLAHYLYWQWWFYSVPITTLTDGQLENLRSDWENGVGWTLNRRSTPETDARRSPDAIVRRRAQERLIHIFEELLRREERGECNAKRIAALRERISRLQE